jgi:FlaA1/EpsC-like NDP-sugar epimerase
VKIYLLQVEDLLPRREVEVNLSQVSKHIEDEVVLVTGAGGSIGSELCRQICRFQPKKLILMGRGENSIYEISLELALSKTKVTYIPVIGDIRDKDRVEEIFARHKPTMIFHAAAHKHVALMELHPEEAFKNNVFGTLNLVRAADAYQAKMMLFISTDKAVNPSSVMGLTKLLGEMIIRSYAAKSCTKFCAVRFGNVLGSRGSVVQLFRKQIAAGGPITITHPEMRRYFMTIREAVQLVLQAGAMAEGGEIFMLDMGEQVKIVDLARNMIRLSELTGHKKIEIKYVGVKPGEKLSEELLTAKENARVTQHRKIFIIHPEVVDQELFNLIEEARDTPNGDYLERLMRAARDKYRLLLAT